MKKNEKLSITKSKSIAILSIIYAISKKFEKIHENSLFSLSSEKARMSKTDNKVAQAILKNFFESVPELEISGTDSTIVNFCISASEMLIEKSSGNVKIRGYKSILDAANKYMFEINKNEVDDSFKLINELR